MKYRTEKKLEWLNRGNRIGRRNVYFPIPHALLFDKFVQHPRRIILLQNSWNWNSQNHMVTNQLAHINFSIFNQQKSQTGIMFASKTETPTAGLCTLYWSREVLHIYPKFTMKSKDCSRQTIHPSIPTHVDICLWALHPVLQLQEPTTPSLTSSHQFQTFLIYTCVVLIVYDVRFRRHYRCQDSGS